jgi:hypothetical protein
MSLSFFYIIYSDFSESKVGDLSIHKTCIKNEQPDEGGTVCEIVKERVLKTYVPQTRYTFTFFCA